MKNKNTEIKPIENPLYPSDVIDNLDSYELHKPLSANQGRILDNIKEDKLPSPYRDDLILKSTSAPNGKYWGQLSLVELSDTFIDKINLKDKYILSYSEIDQRWTPVNVNSIIDPEIERGGTLWNKDINYKIGDTVSFNNKLYICLQDNISTVPVDKNYWKHYNEVYKLTDLDDVKFST
jgi:hypothetical protein